MTGLQVGLEVAFYSYPVCLFTALFSTQLLVFRYRDSRRPRTLDEKTSEKVERFYAWVLWLLELLLAGILFASVILVLYNAIVSINNENNDGSFPYSAYLASHIGVLLYYLAGLLPDPARPWSPSIAQCCAWGASILIEGMIDALFLFEQELIPLPRSIVSTLVGLGTARICILSLMAISLWRREYQLRPENQSAGEAQSLLENGDSSGNGYGASNGAASKHVPASNRTTDGISWFEYLSSFKVLFPYLWPADSRSHQITIIGCVILLIIQRLVQIAVPVSLGWLVEALGYGHIPYREIAVYVVCRGLQGGQGAIGALRAVLWIPVEQALFRRLSCAAFEHVLGLSMDFHLSKRIGEVTSALSNGDSMNTFLEGFLFQVFPMLFDIFVAGVFFFFSYDAFYTLIVFIIMWTYVFLTIYMSRYRVKQRRDMMTRRRDMEATKTDAIMAYETVQHNCAVKAETKNFENHVVVYQKAERLVQLSLNLLNVTQSSVFTLGTSLIVAVSAYKISIGQQKVSEFVTLISYFAQLQAPLGFFGTYYTMIQNNLIGAERMLDLFKETSGVIEKPDAKELESVKGEVRFNNVTFSYQGKEPAIEGISFTVPPGSTTALVGESGGGKSTCLKLLFRFYDVSSGSITVDGQDLRDLKLDSLRRHIGVVPQDTVLFNANIMYNLQYANRDATEADVFDATKAANIHDRIMAFPDKYETMVGERGLKLSGGERQRVAIARAILKNAQILLLDEATASLDSHTERQIQSALERVTENRTTIVIAHRLSTIVTADQIVVLHGGKVVEMGTHAELLALKGRYHAMWEKQTTAKEKAEIGATHV